VKAITVKQPYAWAIAHAGKTIENRGRATSHRGTVAIHAGLGWSEAGQYDDRIERAFRPFLTARQAARWKGRIVAAEHPDRLHFGAVIAVAQLVDCHPGHGDCCRPWGDRFYYGNAHHLVLADVVALAEPVPCLGKVMVPWELPAEVAEQLERAVAP
jgi:hypothetical protein